MLSFFTHPLILIFLLWLFARNEADFSFLTVFYVLVAITMFAFFVSFRHPMLGLLAYVILLPLGLARYCYVSFPKACLITVLFFICQIAELRFFARLFHA